MAGVVASNVRNIRAKSLSLKDTQDQEAEVLRKMQQRQDQITANNQWKRKVVILVDKQNYETYLLIAAELPIQNWLQRLDSPLLRADGQQCGAHHLPGRGGREGVQILGASTHRSYFDR